MPIKRADKNSSVCVCASVCVEGGGGGIQRVRESLDVHSCRYRSIYSKHSVARREKHPVL